MSRSAPSVITCDLEGRIQTFNEGAAELFGYAPEEVIGRKRVSLFSPGPVVLGHVNGWLAAARRAGAFQSRTVFLRKDGTPFAATIRITPTYRRHNGTKKHVGYCGVTRMLPDVSIAEAMPRIGWTTRLISWLVITRAPFLGATLMPLLVAAAWARAYVLPGPFPLGLFLSTLAGAAALHVAANTFNDYFDWRSGTDPANCDYFQPYSGGSRSIELGLISERGLLRVALASLAVAALATVPILVVRGLLLLAFGALGAALAYFYTAPPLRLAARRGLGELAVILGFGPLLTVGTVYALTGQVLGDAFLIGLPIGLLTGAILWINQFPDVESDAQTGKKNLLVTIGKKAGRWGYTALVGSAFVILAVLVWTQKLPAGALAMLFALPLAAYASHVLLAHYLDRELVKASRATIQLHVLAGALLVLGML